MVIYSIDGGIVSRVEGLRLDAQFLEQLQSFRKVFIDWVLKGVRILPGRALGALAAQLIVIVFQHGVAVADVQEDQRLALLFCGGASGFKQILPYGLHQALGLGVADAQLRAGHIHHGDAVQLGFVLADLQQGVDLLHHLGSAVQ